MLSHPPRAALAALATLALALLGVVGAAAPATAATLPCDIYGSAGTACVAARSTTRALYGGYSGRLYQVRRGSDGASTDIGTLATGGYADAPAQDAFCVDTNCVITQIYDQSPRHNDLGIEGPGGAGGQDVGANAAALPVIAGGHRVFGVYVNGVTGYRDNSTSGVAVHGQPEGMYMVASGTHVNAGCCFDYGNAETNTQDTGNGHMDAVNSAPSATSRRAPGPARGWRPTWRTACSPAATGPTRRTSATPARTSPRC